jgi:hypothetical protein
MAREYTNKEIELMIDALWMRQRNFIAGDKQFREYGALLDEFMEKRPGYVPGQYR